jgi:hypothetical protein
MNIIRFKTAALLPAAVLFALSLAPACAQSASVWEFGAGIGAGYTQSKAIKGGPGSASAGFRPGPGGAFWVGNEFGKRYSGEVRYMFQRSVAKLTSGNTSVGFGGNTHQFTYDVLFHIASDNKAKFRPYVVVGGGMKVFQGTGTEQALQPLLQYAALTKAKQWVPVLNIGAGVKWQLTTHALLRFDVRDTMSAFPKEIIFPVPPNKVNGWLHTLTPSIGLAYRWP